MEAQREQARNICHALRCAGYVSLLPYLAHIQGATYATCLYVPIGLFDLLLPVITFVLIIGYGKILSGKMPRRSLPPFWMANVILYGMPPAIVTLVNHGYPISLARNGAGRFLRAFVPTVQPDHALNAVGGLTAPIILIWMPIAALLSGIALVRTIRFSGNPTE